MTSPTGRPSRPQGRGGASSTTRGAGPASATGPAGTKGAAGKTGTSGKSRAPRSKVWRVLRWVGLGAVIVLAIACVGLAILFARTSIPQPNQFVTSESSTIYYNDGTTPMATLASARNRQIVELSQVPKPVQQEVIAAEDRSFYDNAGISVTGIARAVKQAVTGSSDQSGGSTITQQYVKNYFLTSDRTPSRKLTEIIVSVKIDQQMSKDEILGNYLNTIYYGRGAYGIQTASKAYFNKDVSQLTPAEGAVLASVINAPSLYDPALGQKQADNLKARWNYVLDGMVSQGWMSQSDRAAQVFPQISAPPKDDSLSGTNGYIVEDIRSELLANGISDQDLARGGIKVVSTIDKGAQDAAVNAMNTQFPKNAPNVYAGLVAVKPGTGEVVAMYGGADHQARPFSSATDAQIPAGSTFKPFTLIAAAQQGISMNSTVSGSSPLVDKANGITSISNEGGVSYGTISLKKALADSVNTAFVRLNLKIGPANMKAAAIAAGIPDSTPGLDAVPTNTLGTAVPHVWDMASSYATIAAGGKKVTPHLVASASNGDGLDYKADTAGQQAFSADIASDVIDAMRSVTSSGTGARAASLGRPVAGKTGTSEDHKAVWFDGFTPQVAVAVGMYSDVNGVMQPLTNIGGISELSGNSYPLSIWMSFMQTYLKGQPVQQFPTPANGGKVQGIGVPAPSTATSTDSGTAPSTSATVSTSAAPTTSDAPTETATPTQTQAPAPVQTRTQTQTQAPPTTPASPPATTPRATVTRPTAGPSTPAAAAEPAAAAAAVVPTPAPVP